MRLAAVEGFRFQSCVYLADGEARAGVEHATQFPTLFCDWPNGAKYSVVLCRVSGLGFRVQGLTRLARGKSRAREARDNIPSCFLCLAKWC